MPDEALKQNFEEKKYDLDSMKIRNQQLEDKKSAKIEQLKKEREEKELSECTFAPQSFTKNKQRRRFDEFLQSQQKHLEKTQQKINERKEIQA